VRLAGGKPAGARDGRAFTTAATGRKDPVCHVK
jgi:hypothetical protein